MDLTVNTQEDPGFSGALTHDLNTQMITGHGG
jgi:hypothetical protein